MATVQGWDGQDVHHGEGDAEEGRHAPEDAPNPLFGEDAANGDEAAHALVCLRLRVEDEFDLLPIVRKPVEGLGETCRNGLDEGVLLGFNLKIIRQIGSCVGSNHAFVGQVHGQCQSVSLAQHHHLNVLVPELLDVFHKVLIIRSFNVINADDDIACLQSARLGC